MARRGIDRLTNKTAGGPALPVAAGRGPEPSCRHAFDFRLWELLTARLCHELSGPIAAINNGVELLSDEDPAVFSSNDPGFLRDAVALVSGSARRARTRLEFYRFAYGAGASAGAPPCELAQGFFEATRIACTLGKGIRELPLPGQRLACNLLVVGADALPRGGRMELTAVPLSLAAEGEGAILSPVVKAALSLETPVAELTSRTVQAYFAGLLANRLGCRMTVAAEPGRVRLDALADRQPREPA